MRIVCWQTILMKYHNLFLSKTTKMSPNLSSAAVVIGALRNNETAHSRTFGGVTQDPWAHFFHFNPYHAWYFFFIFFYIYYFPLPHFFIQSSIKITVWIRMDNSVDPN